MNRFYDYDKNRTSHAQSIYNNVTINDETISLCTIMTEVFGLCVGKGRCKRCFKNKNMTCNHIFFPCHCPFHHFLFVIEENINNEIGMTRAYRTLCESTNCLFKDLDEQIKQMTLLTDRLSKCSHDKDLLKKFIM